MKTVSDSFGEDTEFPTPVKNAPLKYDPQSPESKYKAKKKKSVGNMLETDKKALVDPVMEDFKKEQEIIRSKPVYQDPVEIEKQKRKTARDQAAEVVNSFPLETNAYGKSRLGTIEKLTEKKLTGGIKSEKFVRTDSATPYGADFIDPFGSNQDSKNKLRQSNAESSKDAGKTQQRVRF